MNKIIAILITITALLGCKKDELKDVSLGTNYFESNNINPLFITVTKGNKNDTTFADIKVDIHPAVNIENIVSIKLYRNNEEFHAFYNLDNLNYKDVVFFLNPNVGEFKYQASLVDNYGVESKATDYQTVVF